MARIPKQPAVLLITTKQTRGGWQVPQPRAKFSSGKSFYWEGGQEFQRAVLDFPVMSLVSSPLFLFVCLSLSLFGSVFSGELWGEHRKCWLCCNKLHSAGRGKNLPAFNKNSLWQLTVYNWGENNIVSGQKKFSLLSVRSERSETHIRTEITKQQQVSSAVDT